MPIDLPHKLIREILLHAAQASASSCRALCKVSTWVRQLVLPLLYTTIPIHAIESITMMRLVCPPTPTFNPAGAVRGIWAPDTYFDNDQWLGVARHCTGMSCLAVSHENFMRVANMRLRSTGDLHVLVFRTENWSVYHPILGDEEYEYGDENVARAQFIQCITHLRLEDSVDSRLDMHNIDSMNRLTHLALSCGEADEHGLIQMFGAVVDDTAVEVFVLVLSLDHATKARCQETENWVYEMREGGEEIVYAVRPLYDDLEKEWDAEVRGGVTIWERAVEHTRELMDRMCLRINPTVSVNLPLELVHNILLYAAESSTSTCYTLCEVSTWVRRFALPLLYTTVSIECPSSLEKFMDLVASERMTCPPTPAFRLADTVRNLCVPVDSRIFETIMRHCNNVTHLAIHQSNLMRLIDSTTPKRFVPELPARQSRCRRRQTKAHEGTGDLQILLLYTDRDWSLSSIFKDVGHSLFERITHLRLEDPIEALQLSVKVHLRHMPRLTHFAVPCSDTTASSFWGVLDVVENTSVEVYVLILMHEHLDKGKRRTVEDWVCRSRKEESRIYAVRAQHINDEMEWEAEVRGDATVWERAVEYTQALMSQA